MKTPTLIVRCAAAIVALSTLPACSTRGGAGVALRTTAPIMSFQGGIRALGAAGPIDRPSTLRDLESQFKATELDMRKALGFITTGQVKDYKYRKNVGFLGVLLGAAATTLNAASAANLVTSTAFTAVQTGITGYLGTNDGLVNPNSNQQLTETKQKIEEAYKDYRAQHAILSDPNTSESDWATAFRNAHAALGTINFQCFSVLPSGQ